MSSVKNLFVLYRNLFKLKLDPQIMLTSQQKLSLLVFFWPKLYFMF